MTGEPIHKIVVPGNGETVERSQSSVQTSMNYEQAAQVVAQTQQSGQSAGQQQSQSGEQK